MNYVIRLLKLELYWKYCGKEEKLLLLWKTGNYSYLLFSSIFYYLLLDFDVKTWTKFSFRDKQFFEIGEVEITRVDYSLQHCHYAILAAL